MALDIDTFSDDVTNIIEDLPKTFVLGDQTVNCFTGPIDKDDELDIPGVYKNRNLSASINAKTWNGDLPKVGDIPTIDGVQYRIRNTSLSTDETQLSMDLMRV